MSQPLIDYTNQDISYITQSLLLETKLPTQADLAVVFGTRHATPIPLAAELYRQNIVRFIVVTGGINRFTQENEAQAHAKLLRAEGVPDEAIVIEDQSTNTLENAQFSLPKIAQKFELTNLKNVIAVAKWFHARRALMTLKRQWPQGIRYYVQNYYPIDIRLDNWHLDEFKRERVMKNWRNISYYLEKGDIAEIENSGDHYS